MKILVIEDSLELCRSIVNLLTLEGHEVTEAHSRTEALSVMGQRALLVLLDIMLPDGRGEELIGQLKGNGHNPHIIMLTALSDRESKRLCYEAGADDYISKPFDMMELLYKVNAIQRREISNAFLQIGPLRIDRVSGEMHNGESYVVLAPSQFRLLDALHRKYLLSETLPPEEIDAHEAEAGVDVRQRVRSLVTRTRRSIQDVGCESVLIRSCYGEGYSLEISSE